MTRVNMAGFGRYKRIRRLQEAEGYEAFSALDIEVSTRPLLLLNVYAGGAAPRRMVPLFYGMDKAVCPDYVRSFTEDGRFTAVFVLHEGEEFDACFPLRGGDMEAEEREDCAESLLHAALECAAMPKDLLCELFASQNLVVDRKARSVFVNCLLPPADASQSATCTLGQRLSRILRRPWSATDAQIDFLDAAEAGAYASIAALYSAWRELLPVMREDRRGKGRLLEKAFRFLKRSWKRWRKRRKDARERRRRLRDEAI